MIILLFALGRFDAQAQTGAGSENAFYVNSVNAAIDQVGESEKAIYSGRNYVQYFVSKGNDGHPYFNDTRAEYVVFDGIRYNSVKFVYDIFKDELVVFTPDSNWITPPKEKITAFSLGGHRHERIDSTGAIPGGFYEVLFKSDEATLISKSRKLFRASVWTEKITHYVIARNDGYVVTNKNELIEALADHEQEVRDFIRREKLKFSKSTKESSFRQVIKFYSSLNRL